MAIRLLLLSLAASVLLSGQPVCPPTPTYSPCDLVLELNDAERSAHPNPYATVELYAEFRSPGIQTYRLPMFWDGGGRFVARFAPTEPGKWFVRFSGNISRFDGNMTSVEAVDAAVPGFVEPANVHHWRTSKDLQPHLWMGDAQYGFATIPEPVFTEILARRKQQRFTHVRGNLLGIAVGAESSQSPLPSPDHIVPEYFQQVDRRIRALNAAGMVVDLILAGDHDQLAATLPTEKDRERYLNYVIGRYAAFNITWELVENFEGYPDGKRLLKQLGDFLRQRDPYKHPRTAGAAVTTSPLLPDGWMTHLSYGSNNNQLGAIEHQLYSVPAVNTKFAREDSGAGAPGSDTADSETFRSRLWDATMNGQYPVYANTGTEGASLPVAAKFADSPGAAAMKVWFDFFSTTRFWELEPYFDVSGARCLGIWGEDAPEYVCYVGKTVSSQSSREVEIRFAKKQKYKIDWINPLTGAVTALKEYKEESWAGSPPDASSDWVLHFYREGHLRSLANRYKFASRDVPVQEPETARAKIPFELAEPADMLVPLAGGWSTPYRIKLTRESRATREMMYLLTAEDTASGQGARVVATGRRFPAVDPRALGKP
ncbi:MAG: DUF5060 domain-containing protein [Bryobacterales bacterium]|nr:DUF5060 domain-containing protein [Bryobacterales bacterium]